MKKGIQICLLVSILIINTGVFAQNNEMTLQLNKDNQTIIDPTSGDMYTLDQDTVNNTGCQAVLGKSSGYFFINGRSRIINAENCYEYTKYITSNNGTGATIGTGDTTPGTGNDSGNTNSEVSTTGTVNTGNNTPNVTNNNIDNNLSNFTTITDKYKENTNLSEYENAIQWLYQNGATKFNSVETFGGEIDFTREQGAKFVLQVARIVNYKGQTNMDCSFLDIDKTHEGLKEWVKESCKYGIFKGDAGNFLPKEPFSNAQVLAVITKIVQNNNIGQTTEPWWQQFYNKTKTLGLLNDLEINENSIYNTATRKDVAILLYRLKKIMNATTPGTNSGNIVDKDIIVNTSNLINQSLSFENDPEFLIALAFMVDNGMTSINNPNEFRPLSYMEKQQWAKYTSTFHQKFFGAKNTGGIPEECFYSDLDDADQYAKADIIYLCKEKLVNEETTLFQPKDFITQGEFIVSVMKMLDIKIDEPTDINSNSREAYYDKATELGIISNTDKIKFADPITRFEAALHYYRLFIRYKFLENYEQDSSSVNNIVSIFDDSTINEITDPNTQKKIAINPDKLLEENGRIGIIQLVDNKKYTLQKEKSMSIYNGSNNWFGSLYSIDTDEKMGIVHLLMNVETKSIIYGSIRMNSGSIYTITPSKLTKAYYIMTLTHNADQTD